MKYEKEVVIVGTIMRSIDQWLQETESDFLVMEKITAADLAIY